MGCTVRVSSPGKDKRFFFLQSAQTGSGAHSGPFSISTPERPEREVDKALPTSAGIKNKWSYAATSDRPSWRKQEKFDLFLPPAWLRYVTVLMKLVKLPTLKISKSESVNICPSGQQYILHNILCIGRYIEDWEGTACYSFRTLFPW